MAPCSDSVANSPYLPPTVRLAEYIQDLISGTDCSVMYNPGVSFCCGSYLQSPSLGAKSAVMPYVGDWSWWLAIGRTLSDTSETLETPTTPETSETSETLEASETSEPSAAIPSISSLST